MRVSFEELHTLLSNVLLTRGFEPSRAELCARLFADTSLDGVYSHGLNRFPRFLHMIEKGIVDVNAEPVLIARIGALERWDGRRGPGNLNAYLSMERAIKLSRKHGIGCVALANTNHWMRGGSYGWQAADADVIGICWTNTLPNLPPWGATDSRIGNNPLVIAVPRAQGHVVLDMAMSQFSYGALAEYRSRGEKLPVIGGYDSEGNLTDDPAAIEASGRPLPIGFWKGSGLALMLDMLAAVLSGGLATHQIGTNPYEETSLSQVFLALDLASADNKAGEIVEQILQHLRSGSDDSGSVRYPGERTLETRKRNLLEGIPVDEAIWREVKMQMLDA